MKSFLLLLCASLNFIAFSQPTQVVRGNVVDSETEYPINGAKVQIFIGDSTLLLRALTNIDGQFEIKNVPVGKHDLTVTSLTYDAKTITIEVNSGKETIVKIPLQESFVEQEEVVVTARKKGEVINELALISAHQFSVSETDRYAGSRSDPARMVSNYAGVGGSDDSRNDIVVRGNSPLGVVWKVEGIDIPNPNHFALAGSSGGPVSILNNKILGNSDFFMSAFPAEYGNSTSGVFDLKLRNGNNNLHELTGQFGFLGTELMAEGPLSKNGNSSYLVMGRYSTLSIFQTLGIKFGTDAVPKYADGAFKFNWKLKNGGALSLFGIGGTSSIEILISEQYPLDLKEQDESTEFYGEGDRDQYFDTKMAVVGLNYKKPISEKTFLTATMAYSYEEQNSHHDYLNRIAVDSVILLDSVNPSVHLMDYKFQVQKASAFFSFNHKINKRHLIKAGLNTDIYLFNYIDSALESTLTTFVKRFDYQGSAVLIQPFVQWKWRITENMAFTAGIHSQYFSQGNALSVAEPRLGWKLNMRKGQAIFAGAGMHSVTQPMYTYFYHQYDSLGNKVYHNDEMGFTRSLHTGIGYEKAFKKSLNLRVEAYYQYLYEIPVTIDSSAFSLVNMGGGFQRFFPEPLKNDGTGYNYGIELTLQKYFDKSFFFLLSATLFDSRYTASDGVERATSYNGKYIANLLAGKEFILNQKQSISIGLKTTVAGGKLYGYVDVDATNEFRELIFKDEGFNSRKFRDYFRLDTKINWKYNAKRVTHEIGLDLVNITGQQNVLSLAYAPDLITPSKEPVAEKYQLGFLPIFYYKIDLRLGGKQ